MRRNGKVTTCTVTMGFMNLSGLIVVDIPSWLYLVFMMAFLVCLLPTPEAAQIRTIYVIPSSHWDRGFTAPPKTVVRRVRPAINEVIDDAATDPDFRWTIESIWQLNSWLQKPGNAKRIPLLRKLIQEGRIEVSDVYGSMHTEFMGTEDLNMITQDGFRMARRLGIAKPDFAMMDDVPGFVRWLPQVLASSGIRFFLNGSNLSFGGGTSLAPSHVPFYWEAPNGRRVLTWVSEGRNGGYTEGLVDYYLAPRARNPYPPHNLLIPKRLWGKAPLEVMKIGVAKLLRHYEEAGYKYDAVLVMFMHDTISPSVEEEDLLPVVRKWNDSGRTPNIRVAVPNEFFNHILAKYRKQIPTYLGDWTGLWAEVKTSSPGISTIARRDQIDLRADGLLWGALALQGISEFPVGNFHQDYRREWNYDAHSGSGGVGWPDLMTVRQVYAQNQQFVDYVKRVEEDQKFLLKAGIDKESEQLCCASSVGTASVGPVLAVYRPESWAGRSIVKVPLFSGSERVEFLKDLSSGRIYNIQWTRSKGVMVAPLPPTGVTLFRPVEQPTAPPSSTEKTERPALENRYYRLELHPSDGSVAQLIDRESRHDVVSTSAPDRFNELIRLVGARRGAAISGRVSFRVTHGPVFDSIEVFRPGSYEPLTEYLLYHGVKRLEIRNLLDRSRVPVVTSRRGNVYKFAFPLLPGSPVKSFDYESGFGMTRYPQDYLPEARKGAVVSHGLVFSSGEFHVAIASPQAFFWELPSLNKGPWQLRQNEVLSRVWRKDNSGETKNYGRYVFPTVGPGLPDHLWFDYELSSWTGQWSSAQAYRKIWDTVMGPFSEVVPRLTTRAVKMNSESLFQTDVPDVVVLSAEPSLIKPGAVVLRLQNVSDKKRLTRVTLPTSALEATQVNLAESKVGSGRLPVEGHHLEVEVGGHATVSVLLFPSTKK